MDKSFTKKIIRLLFLIVLMNVLFLNAFAQTKDFKLKIAVVSSLSLDTLYQDEQAKVLNITTFDNNLKLGWDFYFGFKTAIDTLAVLPFDKQQSNLLEFYYYDLKKIIDPVTQTLSPEFTSITYDLIIGMPVRNDAILLSKFANDNKIPFVSVLNPHATETKNPYHILLNPSFTTHVAEMLKHIRRNNTDTKIKIIVKANEDNPIITETIANLKLSYWAKKNFIEIVPLYDSFYVHKTDVLDIVAKKKNNLFVLTLDKGFTERLFMQLAKNYKTNNYNFFIGGIPTWENNKMIDTMQSPSITFCYSKAFYYPKTSPSILYMNNQYQNKFHTDASDMYWLGYQTALTFTKKIIANPTRFSFLNSLNDTTHKTFYNFVFYTNDNLVGTTKGINDVIENQHLFFIQTNMRTKIVLEN